MPEPVTPLNGFALIGALMTRRDARNDPANDDERDGEVAPLEEQKEEADDGGDASAATGHPKDDEQRSRCCPD